MECFVLTELTRKWLIGGILVACLFGQTLPSYAVERNLRMFFLPRPGCRYVAKIRWMDVLKPRGSFVSCSLHDATRANVFVKHS